MRKFKRVWVRMKDDRRLDPPMFVELESTKFIRGGTKVYVNRNGRATTGKKGEPFGVAVYRNQRDYLDKLVAKKTGER